LRCGGYHQDNARYKYRLLSALIYRKVSGGGRAGSPKGSPHLFTAGEFIVRLAMPHY
jgi:hypothetical protein